MRRKVHFIGVGGVGMAALAVVLKAKGDEVSGCDIADSPRLAWLRREGVDVSLGHDPEHVAQADAVVVTPAVGRSNPELAAVPADCLRYRGEVLAECVSARADSIAVCGSHGKTTTATWIARLLLALGEDVAWAIGGETGDFPVAGAGTGPLVVEADESDGTLALYRAKTLVVNKCDYDHPDHFKTEADYFACYEKAKANAVSVIESERLAPLPELESLPAFSALPAHNRKNARAAVEVAMRRGHPLGAILVALPGVVATLPDRRFQKIADGVYTDYAHHPTEMKCAVEMSRKICPGRLRVLFQPHRYSRTKALLREFSAAFAGADEVILCPTYAAFESPVEGGDVADLYAACRTVFQAADGQGHPCRLYLSRSCDEAWEHAQRSMKEGDLTLLLGAGDIIKLVPRIVGAAKCVNRDAGSVPEPRHHFWIGHGTNTWRSDLNLDVVYEKTTGRAGEAGAKLLAEEPTLCPWMAGIPGTVGGWIKMNAGAFGHSFSEVLSEVKVDGTWIPAEACGFSYRHSDITGEIQDYRLLPPASSTQRQAPSTTYLSRRRHFPAGTYGSFFKNPSGDFAGRLLETVGAKGMRVGGAFVWEEHANVIVRGEGSTSSDVLALARLMRNRVLFRFGISLEAEVQGIVF